VKKKVALALLVLTASIAVAACGGTQEGADIAGSTTPTAPGTPPRGGHTDPHKSCDAQGVNSTQMGIGACTADGVRYVVANYGGVVKMRTLAISILEVGVAANYHSSRRTISPQRDAFLRIKLQVQNLDKVPHRFSFGQTMLGIAEDNYLERTDVERRIHPESLANAGTMGPGELLRGDVVFDITEGDYQQLQRKGRFFIWNFGDHASPQISRGRVAQLGQIRLYAGEVSAEQQQQQKRR
jgi:predicted small secreted protein